MDRTDRSKQFCITLLAEYMFFSDLYGTFSRRHHMLGHKRNLNIFQKTDIIPGNKRVKLKRVVDKRSLFLARVISIQQEDSISLGPLHLSSRPQFSHMVTTDQISSYSFDFYCLAHTSDSKYPTLYDSIHPNTIIPKRFCA